MIQRSRNGHVTYDYRSSSRKEESRFALINADDWGSEYICHQIFMSTSQINNMKNVKN